MLVNQLSSAYDEHQASGPTKFYLRWRSEKKSEIVWRAWSLGHQHRKLLRFFERKARNNLKPEIRAGQRLAHKHQSLSTLLVCNRHDMPHTYRNTYVAYHEIPILVRLLLIFAPDHLNQCLEVFGESMILCCSSMITAYSLQDDEECLCNEITTVRN